MYIIYTAAYWVVHQNAFSTTAGCGAMRGLGVVGAHVFLCKFRGKYPSAARNCRPRELGVVCLASPPRDLQENRGRSFKRPPPPPERYDSIHKCTNNMRAISLKTCPFCAMTDALLQHARRLGGTVRITSGLTLTVPDRGAEKNTMEQRKNWKCQFFKSSIFNYWKYLNFSRLIIWAGVRKFKFRSKGGIENMKS